MNFEPSLRMSPMVFRAAIVSVMMCLTGLATSVILPSSTGPIAGPDLDRLLPEEFGGWNRIKINSAVLPQESDLKPGEAVAYRAYQNEVGRIITLVAAYGPPRGDSVRLHRPEKCYTAQGFTILTREHSALFLDNLKAPIIHMTTENAPKKEAVSYWLRSGPKFVTAPSSGQWINLRKGIARPLDGALIRVSSSGSSEDQFQLHEEFLDDFARSLSPEAASVFLGRANVKKIVS